MIPSQDNDWELAKRAATGDEDAYASLISRYQSPIHSFIFRSVGNTETARDLTQEVFIKAWFGLARIQKKNARFSSWLFQIAINLCRDYSKSKATRQSYQTSSLSSSSSETKNDWDLPHPAPPPDRQSELSEDAATLNKAIQNLPTDLRSAFILGIIENLPYKEVADILRISPKAVETRIYRARKSLVQQLTVLGVKS